MEARRAHSLCVKEREVKCMPEQLKQQHIPVKVYRTSERLMVAAPMAGLEPENKECRSMHGSSQREIKPRTGGKTILLVNKRE